MHMPGGAGHDQFDGGYFTRAAPHDPVGACPTDKISPANGVATRDGNPSHVFLGASVGPDTQTGNLQRKCSGGLLVVPVVASLPAIC